MDNEYHGPAFPIDSAQTQLSERVGTARAREATMAETTDALGGVILLTSADFSETMKDPRKIARVDGAIRKHLEETGRPFTPESYAAGMEELRIATLHGVSVAQFQDREVLHNLTRADFDDTMKSAGKVTRVHDAAMRYLAAHPPKTGAPFVAAYLDAMNAVRAAVTR